MSTKANMLHADLLTNIIKNSGRPTQHTFLDNYLGNNHHRYSISTPQLRSLAKTWMKLHSDLTMKEFLTLISSLIKAPSSTEKVMAGILFDYADHELLKFNPHLFDTWLNHLIGWAEVDSLCYGHIPIEVLLENWNAWKSVIDLLSKSKNVNKRRAALVLLCKPVTQSADTRLRSMAFKVVDQLQLEKEILITKAISWLLRSMIKLHREDLLKHIEMNREFLPAIAVRETLVKLKTGRKSLGKKDKQSLKLGKEQ